MILKVCPFHPPKYTELQPENPKVAWWIFCALEGLQDRQHTEVFY